VTAQWARNCPMPTGIPPAWQAAGASVLHVPEGFPQETVYSGARAFRLVEDYRARVEKVKRGLRSLVPPDALNWCEVDTDVVSGIAHDAINATAAARKADLVVLGTPARSRFDRIAMASTPSGVLRRARCPVLAVPRPSAVTEWPRKTTTADRDDEPMALFPLPATHGGAAGNSERHR
jgi:nucleotide-binding universal stress UspA family protein